MTMPITSVMSCRFIDPSRPLGQMAFRPAGVYQRSGERARGSMRGRNGRFPLLSGRLVDDASPPDRVAHLREGADVRGRIAREHDEIGGTSHGDAPRAGLGAEAP